MAVLEQARFPAMPDDPSDAPEQLLPVDRHHLVATLSFALTHESRLAKTQAADVTASIVAEQGIRPRCRLALRSPLRGYVQGLSLNSPR